MLPRGATETEGALVLVAHGHRSDADLDTVPSFRMAKSNAIRDGHKFVIWMQAQENGMTLSSGAGLESIGPTIDLLRDGLSRLGLSDDVSVFVLPGPWRDKIYQALIAHGCVIVTEGNA